MTRSLLLFDAGFEPTCSFTIVGMSSPPLSGVTLRTLLMRPRYVNQLNVFRPRDISTGSTRGTHEMMSVPDEREPALPRTRRITLPSIPASVGVVAAGVDDEVVTLLTVGIIVLNVSRATEAFNKTTTHRRPAPTSFRVFRKASNRSGWRRSCGSRRG